MPDLDEAAAEIERLAAELGIDLDGDGAALSDADASVDEPSSEDDPDRPLTGADADPRPEAKRPFTTDTSVRFEPVSPADSTAGDHTRSRSTEMSYEETIRKQRPSCPSCGFMPTAEDDPLSVPIRECWVCATEVCRECGAECRSCARPMCDDHKDGHGLEDEPLCADHAAQVAAQYHHDRDLERREESRKLLDKRLTHEHQWRTQEWTERKQHGDWGIDRQQKRFDNKVTAAKFHLELWKLRAAIRAHKAAQTTRPAVPARRYQVPDHFKAIEHRLQQFTAHNQRFTDQWQTTETDQTDTRIAEPTNRTRTRSRVRNPPGRT